MDANGINTSTEVVETPAETQQKSSVRLVPVVNHKKKTITLQAVNPERRIRKQVQNNLAKNGENLTGRQWRKLRKWQQRLTNEEKELIITQLRSESDTHA